MTDMKTLSQRLYNADLRWPAVVVSCLFSLLVIATNPIPNDDAFGYLRAAEIFLDQGLAATLSAYGWYSYSVLIAITSQVIPGDLMASAHLLNTLALALLVHAFITLAMEYRQSRKVQLFATLIILCYPTLNEMRFNLVRDFAYWGFCLTALVQLVRYNRTGAIIHACGWLLAMACAVFFRLEGLIILLVSPFSLLLWDSNPLPDRLRQVATLFLFMFAGTLIVLLLFLPAAVNLVDVFNYAWRWYLPLLTNYPDTLVGAASGEQLSNRISAQLEMFTAKGMFVLFAGYLYAVLANLVMATGPAATLFLGYGFYSRRQALPGYSRGPLLFFLGSALLALLTFVSIMQFLTTRYAVMSALLLLSVMPLYLHDLYQQAAASGQLKRFRVIGGFCVFYFLLDSLVSFGYSKRYIEDAIDWTRDNIPASSLVVTNNFAMAYYTGLVPDYDRVKTDPLEVLTGRGSNDFLVLDLAHDDDAAMTMLAGRTDLVELARFANNRDDAIIVFRVNSFSTN